MGDFSQFLAEGLLGDRIELEFASLMKREVQNMEEKFQYSEDKAVNIVQNSVLKALKELQ